MFASKPATAQKVLLVFKKYRGIKHGGLVTLTFHRPYIAKCYSKHVENVTIFDKLHKNIAANTNDLLANRLST